ncbi:M24 family metallopeptidase [Thermoflavimicrobium daqui]|uniref:Aminopeptidase P family protein n=1 Tax=Thermoflavimicrobium daqui TaxID=2137476 RepID=A0A364K8X9_9BACL|nr:Xaa-Pro peptidase family protein [Thermoflavimicrobium daqui]RAL26751.1 aminopeptidase P family protein [Thermoflavimicrobium daqui]
MHPLPKVPKSEIESRIQRLQNAMRSENIDGALITQNIDLYYLTGTMQNGVLFLPADGEPCLYVKRSLVRAKFEASVPVEEMGRFKELSEKLREQFANGKRLGIEMDVLPYGLALRYLRCFPDVEPVDLSYLLRLQRAIKSPYELEQLEESAKMVKQVIDLLPEMIRPGVSEVELAAKIEYQLRMMGNFGLYRMRAYNQELVLGMVASGVAAATPTYFDGPAGGLGLSIANPQGASRKIFAYGEPILVDISAVCEGYIIDQTRLAVIGELDDDLKHAYEVTRQILKEIEQLGKPGIPWRDLYNRGCEMAKAAGLEKHFMGYGPDQVRFLGHGVGLELDELPVLANGFSEPLEEGMVIAIEPKFTFPERGVVGIENTYVVKPDGLKSITFASEEIIYLDS